MPISPDALHSLKNPPVVETAISVQFAPIGGLTVAHAGWFWKEFLGASWVSVNENTALDEQFERFELNQFWKTQFFQLTAFEKPPLRIQINNADDGRIIQIQNNRFIYNWKKGSTDYPSFEKTYAEFSENLDIFRDFLRTAKLGEIQINQWELTYIDHVPKGELWQTPADFHRVFPGLYSAPILLDNVMLETISGEQRFEIVPKRGRVYVVGRHGKLPGEIEAIVLQTTARGPVEPTQEDSGLDFGLRLGHEAIGRVFLAITSDAAMTYWRSK